MAIELPEQIRIDYLSDEELTAAGVRLGMLRLDTIHPLVSGNKWFKLKKNIQAAQAAHAEALLTFGGAYSNHLLATAAAAQAAGMASIGIVRGQPGPGTWSDTLKDCHSLGMDLVFASREIYSRKYDDTYLAQLKEQYPRAWIIPEGGNNEAGRAGAAAITTYLPEDSTHVAVAIGTGTTFSGIRETLDPRIALLGFPAMKGGAYLEPELKQCLSGTRDNWQLCTDYHFGGFARHTETLITFMNMFYDRYQVPLDFVYTAKMMYGITEMIRNGIFPPGSHIIGIHTGGLQGNRSLGHLLHSAATGDD